MRPLIPIALVKEKNSSFIYKTINEENKAK